MTSEAQRALDKRIEAAVKKHQRRETLSNQEWMLVCYANQRCMPAPQEHRLHLWARA